MEHETFWSLLKDPAHWWFELFLIFLFDIVLGLLLLPYFKYRFLHHVSDDARIAALEKEVQELKAKSSNK